MKYVVLAGWFVLVAVLVVGIRLASSPMPHLQQIEAAQPSLALPDAASIEHGILTANALNAKLDEVAARTFKPRAGTPVIAYASDVPAAKMAVSDTARQTASLGRGGRVVTLLYSGDGFKRAVVNGKYVRVGDRLPGGARVLRITDSGVLIRGANGRQVLHVPESRRVSRSGGLGAPR